jgi:hypothetical protein
MTNPIQLSLFQDSKPETALEAIERRLPRKDWIPVSDVATAFDRSVATVYNWIEEGLVTDFDSGSCKRSAYLIYRPSVIALAKSRLGIEPQPKKGEMKK